MVKAQGILRDYPAGTAANGETVTFKKEVDDTTITSDTTDADGAWQYVANGAPGPWYWTSTIGSTVRAGSSMAYGSGGAYSLYELAYVLRALETGTTHGGGVVDGYLNELAVTYDGAGLDLDIATGALLAAGVPAVFATTTHLTSVGTRDVTNPKACYVVVEVTPPGQALEGKSEIVAVCGTAGASPTLPTLTNSEVLRQVPLATYRLPNTSSTTLTTLADARQFLLDPTTLTPEAVQSSIVRRTDPTSEATTTSTTGADVTSLTTTVTLTSGVTYDIEARAFLVCKISSASATVSIAPYLDGTSNLATYLSGNHTSYLGLANAFTLAGVVGSGAAISCGLRIKVSSGTATYQSGYLLVIARPR